jgi:hypothetical protein
MMNMLTVIIIMIVISDTNNTEYQLVAQCFYLLIIATTCFGLSYLAIFRGAGFFRMKLPEDGP